MQLGIFRCPSPLYKAQTSLAKAAKPLLNTTYHRRAPLEMAPGRTDCVTAAHYLYASAFELPLPVTYIGDMPRLLASLDWEFSVISPKEMRAGDLLFMRNKQSRRLITHLAVAMDVNQVFHCCRNLNGAIIEPIEDALIRYHQNLDIDWRLYIDYRNRELRRIHMGKYMAAALGVSERK